MRRTTVVAGVVLIIALVMVATPVIAGSRAPSPDRVVATTILPVMLRTEAAPGPVSRAATPRLAFRAARLDLHSEVYDVAGTEQRRPAGRPAVTLPAPVMGTELKPPRLVLRGVATWYDNGTTALRLPRGTVVRICGPGGCVERVVSDWGPSASARPARVADLTPADFRTVCGCSLSQGVVRVRVDVY